ncbi:hypothetical protein CHI12_06155 [Terribacillus saccharophilus]|uniref:Uncharacterized protein n=1 Tax=Terribacillus saccharophilus TaxID=361277 RepID=A0A268HFD6_9BACI|nr:MULTISPECIES: hypothetical protein [Terribacillus]PAE08568.1 hypothetical protein CHI12_06155 [Terribacillus saccharophilus]
MKYLVDFILAIILTGLSYYVGSLLFRHGLPIWQAILIGFSVVALGAMTEALGAPIWLIVLVPFPVGMLLLYLFLQVPITNWLITYATTLVFYTLMHIPMSYFFQFHSLIPAWKLS